MRIFRPRQPKSATEPPAEPAHLNGAEDAPEGHLQESQPGMAAEPATPTPTPTAAARLITLLGREFPVIPEGLDPKAVAGFLENVAGSSGAALQRLEHYASLQKLCASMETMADEARQMADHIKEQARQEAELEKNRLLADSLKDAEAIRNDSMQAASQTRAQAAAEAQAEKSRILEEARSNATQMAAQAESDIRQLRENVQLELDSEKARMLETARQEAERVIAEARQGINGARERAILEAESEKNRIIETARAKARQLVDETRQACARALQSASVELSRAVGGIESSAAKPVPESPATSPPVQSRPAAQSTGAQPSASAAVEANVTKATLQPPRNGNGLSSGEVALLVPPEANLAWILQLRRRLERLSGAQIIFQGGADKAGTVVVISLSEPVPLATELSAIPGVDRVVVDESGKAFSFGAIPGSPPSEQHPRKTMTICLQKTTRENGEFGFEPVRQPV